ncbi:MULTISPECIES: phage major capsid protein, P2 family [Pseudomonas]|uniref:Capsid protein n=1 Tax=Pseudomonas fulva TaxID=47880 RepID=A0A0D0JNX3_9PSED|nr:MULTISPECIES: phage major capsid protein, P2 family [Pseudomonas]KIP97028.1 capsid protein [Pseudomonas fulva]
MSRALSARAEQQYYALQEAIAEAYGVSSAARQFAVEATIAQELNDKITEKSDFLGRINVVPVDEIKGEKVIIGLNGPASSRTDTTQNDRVPRHLLDLDNLGYELFSTETDVALRFATIDSWAKFSDFAERYSAAVQRQIALDRIMVGWNGTHAAVQTNLANNPLLQDVNKGWMQIAREQIPAQVLTTDNVASKISLGAGGDYANLDALVHDIKQMIDPVFRDAGDLVAIVGSDLLAYDKGKLYAAQGQTPTEKERIEEQQVIATYGGLQSFVVPFFPATGVVVTSWDNLSLYYQSSSWRRHLLENPKRSQVEDYNARNEGYVIEQLGKFAAIEANRLELV